MTKKPIAQTGPGFNPQNEGTLAFIRDYPNGTKSYVVGPKKVRRRGSKPRARQAAEPVIGACITYRRYLIRLRDLDYDTRYGDLRRTAAQKQACNLLH